ncbi:MAG: vanadium-dependent haloperoxidase [Pirellulales bacterium]|nr:vanadium-dependent haloperoxidase [Pirellulales bacterium]
MNLSRRPAGLRWLAIAAAIAIASPSRADLVLDWNATLRSVMQQNGTGPTPKADPGWSTRSIAMMNTAIYDAFQAKRRTHRPWLIDAHAGDDTSLDAAVNQAAYEILSHCYPSEASLVESDYNARMTTIPDGLAKTNGIALGSLIANACVVQRTSDGASTSVAYTPLAGPGRWQPDPYHPGQNAWGPEWGAVATFGIPSTTMALAAIPAPPALTSQQYADAYNQVKDYGAVDSPSRTAEQTEIGLFWAYDRASMGPPPVLFMRHLAEIAAQAGNTAADNARLFALASVAQADAAIASWDAKFQYNFWRPVGAIQDGDADGNPLTVGDSDWRPLGAPGSDSSSVDDDFTPPFPSWTSGHATMGGAIFKSLELFYGTNSFDEIDGAAGNDFTYVLTSEEAGGGGPREFSSFTQVADLAPGMEDSPEGENGMSRVYLGVHWLFDQRDGIALGHNIAQYVASNYFQAAPEPTSIALAAAGMLAALSRRRPGRYSN